MVDLGHIQRTGANSEAESSRLLEAHRHAMRADFEAACRASANEPVIEDGARATEVKSA